MLSEEQFVPPKSGQETEKEPVFTTSGITKQTNDLARPVCETRNGRNPGR
ncbi:hypothetical protein ACSE3M_04250 [Bacillus velezensis]